MKNRTYKTVDVEHFDLATILPLLLAVGVIVAVDVAKTKFVAAIATAKGEVLRLLRFEHPRQTLVFLRIVEALRDAKLEPRMVMEPTGTYGDALRYQCHARGVPVHMMSPKHTHDFAEVLDGVPSMHDPKAAMVLARLATIRSPPAWEPESDEKRDVRALMDQRGPVSKTLALYHGHLEAMLARHWPEFGTLIDVHEQRSWMTLLRKYPGPQAVTAAKEEAARTLRSASRGRFGTERIAAVVDSASTTLGVPMTTGERAKLDAFVTQIEQQALRLDEVDAEIANMVGKDREMSFLAVVVGPACSAAIVSYVGRPTAFTSPKTLEKAVGLNLKEHSSGNKTGALSITKRGPGQVRQLLYLAVLRLLQQDPVLAAWCRARTSYNGPSGKTKAIVAVMRKLIRALWHVARGHAFDATKLFDTRRLKLSVTPQEEARNEGPEASRPVSVRKPFTRKQPSEGGVIQQRP